MELRGYDLRYLLTSSILDLGGKATTVELRHLLTGLGVTLGSDPRRRLYGALRSEVRKGRLRPLGHGRYEIDDLPRSTRDRVRRHARAIEAAIEAGETHPPRRNPPRTATRFATPSASPFRDALRSNEPFPWGTPAEHAARREKAKQQATSSPEAPPAIRWR